MLSNRQFTDHLPADWYTLGLLAPVEPERLEAAIDDGFITPNLNQKGAKRLLRSWRDEDKVVTLQATIPGVTQVRPGVCTC